MCASCNDRNHLDDSIDDLIGDASFVADVSTPEGMDWSLRNATPEQFAKAALAGATSAPKTGDTLYYEPCKDCRGTGRFYSYTGRLVGNCFKCKGAGQIGYKTSPEARAKQVESRQRAEEAKIAAKNNALEAWLAAHTEEHVWLTAAAKRGFNFAGDMLTDLAKYGTLLDWKLEKVRKFMVQDQVRTEEKAKAEASAVAIEEASLDKIMTAFAVAVSRDIMYPKLRLDTFVFSLCRSGKNAGSIYVKHASETNRDGEKLYLGRITDGKFVKAFACTPEWEAAVVAAASDPEAAAVAYGRRYGCCSMCGRVLTNAESIDRGIGPICASNFGW